MGHLSENFFRKFTKCAPHHSTCTDRYIYAQNSRCQTAPGAGEYLHSRAAVRHRGGSRGIEYFVHIEKIFQLFRMVVHTEAVDVSAGSTEIVITDLHPGYLADGTLLTALFDIGFDPLETLTLYLEKEPASVSLLQPDGTEAPLVWTAAGEGIYSIQTRVEPMYPAVLLIR